VTDTPTDRPTDRPPPPPSTAREEEGGAELVWCSIIDSGCFSFVVYSSVSPACLLPACLPGCLPGVSTKAIVAAERPAGTPSKQVLLQLQ